MISPNLTNEILRISGANARKCMKCGKCSAACPNYDAMDVHPHQFADMLLTGRVEELMASQGIYSCLSCFACSERCPRDVEPARLIEAVRLAVIRQRENNHMKPDAVPSLLDDALPQQAIVSALRKFAK